MRVVRTVKEVRQIVHQRAGQIGFVPTMGALHDGHVSLIQRARRECDTVVASIFVNPLQFGAHEDLSRYPRPFDADAAKALESGVDVLFAPAVEEMYPHPIATTVTAGPIGGLYEGASRPGHFDGVATVVTKLLSIVGPCRAYFGEKDFQQLTVIRQLVGDLSLPVDVVGCAIVRKPSGLAMSSRNVYLTDAQRSAATVLHRALQAAVELAASGDATPIAVEDRIREIASSEPLVNLDYAVVVNSRTLERPPGGQWPTSSRALVAAVVGTTRLIDNAAVGE